MKPPALLQIYRALGGAFSLVYGLIYHLRAHQGKEDSSRINERYGDVKIPRPKGALIWIHGASVGECALALSLADELLKVRPNLQFLFTSQTISSAKFMANNMKTNQRQQYLPMDSKKAMGKFLDHWQVDLAILLESEIWPNLIMTTKQRKVPLVLLNARMNLKSRQGWAKKDKIAKYLFTQFNWIAAADQETALLLEKFTNQTVIMPGNMKVLIKPTPPSADKLEKLSQLTEQRPIWLAASTHNGEDSIILQAHQQILQQLPNALLILTPRHPERGSQIAELASQMNISFARRNDLLSSDKQVWITDSIGEMQYWLSLAKIVFVGGSIISGKGHNPLEAIFAGKPVLSGPNVDSFARVYRQLSKLGSVKFTSNSQQISKEVIEQFKSPSNLANEIIAANNWIQQQADNTKQQVLPKIISLLDREKT